MNLIMRKFKRLILITTSSLLFSSGVSAADTENNSKYTSLLNMDLASLGELQVYTASRELTSIERSPSVVSVITAEQIKNRGLTTLSEVLERVAGFFIAPDSSQAIIGNRGYTQNPNNNYLMLIDGHAVNSVMDEGVGNMHLLPFLYQVKRIEVVRGPGSTLWGGAAANGIIHIFTYDGSELAKMSEDGTQVNTQYDFDRKRNVVNALTGIKLGEKASLMLSATRTESRNEFSEIYQPNNTELVPYNGYYKYESWRPSTELHAKFKYDDFFIDARSVRFASYYKENTTDLNDDTRDHDFDYIRLGYNSELKSDLTLDTNIYNNASQTKAKVIGPKDGWSHMSYDEKGFNGVLTYTGFKDHRIKTGLQYQYRDFQPRITQGGQNTVEGIEQAKGIFAEEEYSGIKDWHFTLGLRYQENDFRQASKDWLPRVAAIWSYSPEVTLKYLYNTGVMPVSLTRSRSSLANPIVSNWAFAGGDAVALGPEKPQYSKSHDLQFLYQKGNTRANLTLFYGRIEGYVARPEPFDTGETLSDGTPIWILESNLANLTSYGLELELERRLNSQWLLYSNYAYAINEADETTGTVSGTSYDLVNGSTYFTDTGRMTGAPEHIWNLGFDYSLTKKVLFNLHYRGWTGALGKTAKSPVKFDSYGPEHFLDINVRGKDFILKGLEVGAYVKNLFDNKHNTPQSPHGGHIVMSGRHVGVNLSYRF